MSARRAHELLTRMTLDDKLHMVSDVSVRTYVGQILAILRLCIPSRC